MPDPTITTPLSDFPTPDVELTHLLVVADAEVSRQWYESVLGATLHHAYGGTSVVLKLQGQWLAAGRIRLGDSRVLPRP